MDIIRTEAVNQLLKLQQRFISMQRTVTLTRGFVNNSALPVVPNLPAAVNLDSTMYNQVRSACPGLNLPVIDNATVAGAPGISQVERMRTSYQQAVASQLDKVEQSALNLIDQLQNELDTQIDKVLDAVGPFVDYANCICTAATAINDPNTLAAAVSFYNQLKNFRPTLIDQELEGKLHSLTEAKLNLKNVLG
jgi:hypothetical protein